MNEIFTKSSVEAKLTDEDINLFAKVCEKGINDYTDKNQEYTNDFQLTEDIEDFYRLKKFRVLKKMEPNNFTKQAISDRFTISVERINKNKCFLKCQQNNQLALEIAMSEKQLQAIEDKFNYRFKLSDNVAPTEKYQLFYAGTFMYKDKENNYLSSKLANLKLFKIVKAKKGK